MKQVCMLWCCSGTAESLCMQQFEWESLPGVCQEIWMQRKAISMPPTIVKSTSKYNNSVTWCRPVWRPLNRGGDLFTKILTKKHSNAIDNCNVDDVIITCFAHIFYSLAKESVRRIWAVRRKTTLPGLISKNNQMMPFQRRLLAFLHVELKG